MIGSMPHAAHAAGTEPQQQDQTVELPLQPATTMRRAAACVLDLAVLVSAAALALNVELSFGAGSESLWFQLAWYGIVAPLYFALYHSFGTGATPGQLELRIAVRDEATGGLIGFGRALLRVCGSLLSFVLVVPALIACRDLEKKPGDRTLADRLTRTTTVAIPLHGKAPELAAPTVPEFRELFDGEAMQDHLRRGRALVRESRGLVLRCVAAVYGGLLVIVALFAGLTLADSSTSGFGTLTVISWLELALMLLVSGVFWTQAVVVHAVEHVRTGNRQAGVGEILRRSVRRANALSVVLLLVAGAVFVSASSVIFVPALIVFAYRFAFVVPALALEDTRVFGSFARSFQLTADRWRATLALMLKSAAILVGAGLVAAGFAACGIAVAWSTDNLAVVILAAVTGLAIACAPVVYALTVVGAAWSVLYEDLRRELPPGKKKREKCSR